jgi:hypothetical protein
MSALADALAEAGGVGAPPELTARLRELVAGELARGEAELGRARTGYGDPIAVVFGPGERGLLAACPLPVESRADAGAAPARAWLVAAAAIGALVEVAGAPADGAVELLAGRLDEHLALAFPLPPSGEAAELAALAFDEAAAGVDRLRARGLAAPAAALAGVEDLREPIGAAHPFRVAETVARLGGRPADDASVDGLEDAVLTRLEPAGAATPAHRDPDPARRVARRIVQRLDGMGKWGGYHTEFVHLARGFAGNDRALALQIGERLLAAGVLEEKVSVGQRHVFLNPRRSGEIRAFIADGTLPAGLELG